VLLIDDSVLVRRVVSRAFENDPAVDVVGVVRNGRGALLKIDRLHPDVVVIDSVVAGEDGFDTLAEIARRYPQVRVVLFSASTLSEEQVRGALRPLIAAGGPPPAPPAPSSASRDREVLTSIAIVVIAVSTGGPDALVAVVSKLPAKFPVPVLIVQHMPAGFTKLLAERLDRESAVSVVEASEGDLLRPGLAYVAPGGRHLALAPAGGKVSVMLHDGPRENSCRPAADVLFRSAAEVYGPQVLAVVLTGMGRDGFKGAEAVRSAGGVVVAQSEATSVIASMPHAVAAAGLANEVVPLEGVGGLLTHWVSRGR